MKNKIVKYTYFLLLIPLLLGAEAQATIYKCVKANADVYYNDKPCPVNDKESQINSVKDPEGGYIAPEFVSDEKESNTKSIVVGKDLKSRIDDRKLEESNYEEIDNNKKLDSSELKGNESYNQNGSVPLQQEPSSSESNSNLSEANKRLKEASMSGLEAFH